VSAEVLAMIGENWDVLCREWDARFPNNPVAGEDDNEN
jgi:hypothetical protein